LEKNNYNLGLNDDKEEEIKEGEWLKLSDVVEIKFGTRITKTKDGCNENDNDCYPVYGGGNITFYTKQKNRSNETIIMSRFGVSQKCVRIIKGDIFLNDSGMSIHAINGINISFIKYYLYFDQFNIYERFAEGQGQKNMMTERLLEKYMVPSLSLQHQEEIVEFLDKQFELYRWNEVRAY
jgi:type I restriction enzyme S subunit